MNKVQITKRLKGIDNELVKSIYLNSDILSLPIDKTINKFRKNVILTKIISLISYIFCLMLYMDTLYNIGDYIDVFILLLWLGILAIYSFPVKITEYKMLLNEKKFLLDLLAEATN